MTILDEFRGKTVYDVVDALRAKGIKGRKRSVMHCPIAHYLSTELQTENVLVTYGHATCDDVIIPLPDEVGVFIVRFDDGCYPDLEEE